jgi:hypothetical protein
MIQYSSFCFCFLHCRIWFYSSVSILQFSICFLFFVFASCKFYSSVYHTIDFQYGDRYPDIPANCSISNWDRIPRLRGDSRDKLSRDLKLTTLSDTGRRLNTARFRHFRAVHETRQRNTSQTTKIQLQYAPPALTCFIARSAQTSDKARHHSL